MPAWLLPIWDWRRAWASRFWRCWSGPRSPPALTARSSDSRWPGYYRLGTGGVPGPRVSGDAGLGRGAHPRSRRDLRILDGLATTDMGLAACLGLAFLAMLVWAEEPTRAHGAIFGFSMAWLLPIWDWRRAWASRF